MCSIASRASPALVAKCWCDIGWVLHVPLCGLHATIEPCRWQYLGSSLKYGVEQLRLYIQKRVLGKAGASRWRGIRPTVRGVAMNPVDHPHGGGQHDECD